MKCLIHPECIATAEVDKVDLCYECWSKANVEERGWFKKAIAVYNRGLLTKRDLEDYLFTVSYHEVDPTVPVHIRRELKCLTN